MIKGRSRRRCIGLLCLALLVSCVALANGPGAAAQEVQAALEWRIDSPSTGGIKSLGTMPDGITSVAERSGMRALTPKTGLTPASSYLYFDIDDARAKTLKAPLYLIVEYFDASPGQGVFLEYDSATGENISAIFHRPDMQSGGWTRGTGKWKKTYFRIDAPRFSNRQNGAADFRFTGGPLFLRSARLVSTRPADWEANDIIDMKGVRPRVKIGANRQFIVGGFDSARVSDVPQQTRALSGAMPNLKELGVTSHELYVRWNLCEPREGRYDWSVCDAYVRVYKKYGLKWAPLVLAGPAYTLPDWYYKKPGSQGYICLEHGQESDVQSLWNPVLRAHVARFLKAFCERYRDSGVIETLLVGVTGNYGEALYPVSGNDWTSDLHGNYHTHPGFWAGDPYAIADFTRFLHRKYASDVDLSRAWGKPFQIDAVRPFLQKDAPNDRAWLDFLSWYIGSMTDYSRFVMREARRSFPRGDIQFCTGGDAQPPYGSDFGEQSRVAAEVGGGLRITNEGSDYAQNFVLTRWVASAARQYGARYSFEPAGPVDANGVIVRVYNAAASGANGLHYYSGNLFDTEAARRNFILWGSQFHEKKPLVEIAVYYPETHNRLYGNTFLSYVQPLRDYFDFDYMSDDQIRDDGLKRTKALILMQGAVSEAATWNKIIGWVRAGGMLLYADGIGRLHSVEGDDRFHRALFDTGAKLGKGRVVSFHGAGNSAEYRAFLTNALADAKELSPLTRTMVHADGKEDGLFGSVSNPNELLWLNTANTEKRTNSAPPLLVAPHAIVAQRVTAP